MSALSEVERRRRRTYAILTGIIVLTVPCYCAGFFALMFAPNTPTPGAATALPSTPTQLVLPTTAAAPTTEVPTTPTLTVTPGGPTVTKPATPTQFVPPTSTFTPSPTFTPTATFTNTPTITNTHTATFTGTSAASPTVTFTPSATPNAVGSAVAATQTSLAVTNQFLTNVAGSLTP
ncbi:MAG: hypothetical protein AAB382_06740, partial [Chloroflexota bacterium]